MTDDIQNYSAAGYSDLPIQGVVVLKQGLSQVHLGRIHAMYLKLRADFQRNFPKQKFPYTVCTDVEAFDQQLHRFWFPFNGTGGFVSVSAQQVTLKPISNVVTNIDDDGVDRRHDGFITLAPTNLVSKVVVRQHYGKLSKDGALQHWLERNVPRDDRSCEAIAVELYERLLTVFGSFAIENVLKIIDKINGREYRRGRVPALMKFLRRHISLDESRSYIEVAESLMPMLMRSQLWLNRQYTPEEVVSTVFYVMYSDHRGVPRTVRAFLNRNMNAFDERSVEEILSVSAELWKLLHHRFPQAKHERVLMVARDILQQKKATLNDPDFNP